MVRRLLSVNQEDGFNIRVLQENDGTKHLQAFWFDDVLQVEELQNILRITERWPLYELRAIFLVKGRIQEQLSTLESLGDMQPLNQSCTSNAWHVIKMLQGLEKLLLNLAKSEVEVKVCLIYRVTRWCWRKFIGRRAVWITCRPGIFKCCDWIWRHAIGIGRGPRGRSYLKRATKYAG